MFSLSGSRPARKRAGFGAAIKPRRRGGMFESGDEIKRTATRDLNFHTRRWTSYGKKTHYAAGVVTANVAKRPCAEVERKIGCRPRRNGRDAFCSETETFYRRSLPLAMRLYVRIKYCSRIVIGQNCALIDVGKFGRWTNVWYFQAEILRKRIASCHVSSVSRERWSIGPTRMGRATRKCIHDFRFQSAREATANRYS